jgi:hypothetical protein
LISASFLILYIQMVHCISHKVFLASILWCRAKVQIIHRKIWPYLATNWMSKLNIINILLFFGYFLELRTTFGGLCLSLFFFPLWGAGTLVIGKIKNHFIFSFSIPLFGQFLPIKKANTLDFIYFWCSNYC